MVRGKLGKCRQDSGGDFRGKGEISRKIGRDSDKIYVLRGRGGPIQEDREKTTPYSMEKGKGVGGKKPMINDVA